MDALGPLELTVAPREFTCVVGPSGCGKSTLLRIAAGLPRPSTGTLSAKYRAPAPLQVAPDKGEFERESLDVTLKMLPTPEALPLLAFDIRWVAGSFSPSSHSKSGLWVRLKDGETAADVNMSDRRLGTMIGKAR